MFLLISGKDPIEGLFLTNFLKIWFGPTADLAAESGGT